MLKSLCVKPLGVQLGKFKAEVEVVAQNIVTGNILIKSFNDTFKELTFSNEEDCWVITSESKIMPILDENSQWKRIVKGIDNETSVRTTIPIEA